MKCPFKFGNYDFEGAEDCIGIECGMHRLCNADDEITAVEFDALDEHAQALERENEELRKLCGANDTLSDENDVSEESVDANDGNAMQDSREKLEADVRKEIEDYAGRFLDGEKILYELIVVMLDRQAALDRKEFEMILEEIQECMRNGGR